jgi:tRNA 2-thiouridine synthesizing protein C
MPLKYEDEDDDWAEKDSIHVVSSEELSEIMDQSDVVLSF